jgi:hypothetical protein
VSQRHTQYEPRAGMLQVVAGAGLLACGEDETFAATFAEIEASKEG